MGLAESGISLDSDRGRFLRSLPPYTGARNYFKVAVTFCTMLKPNTCSGLTGGTVLARTARIGVGTTILTIFPDLPSPYAEMEWRFFSTHQS